MRSRNTAIVQNTALWIPFLGFHFAIFGSLSALPKYVKFGFCTLLIVHSMYETTRSLASYPSATFSFSLSLLTTITIAITIPDHDYDHLPRSRSRPPTTTTITDHDHVPRSRITNSTIAVDDGFKQFWGDSVQDEGAGATRLTGNVVV